MDTTVKAYKIADPEENISFKNNHLTELFGVKAGKKKKIGDNYAIRTILADFLKDYGIIITGNTVVRNLSGKHTDSFLTAIAINEDFPVENEFLIKEIYGWKNAIISIMFLAGDKNNDECAYHISYNTETESFTVEKLYYGSALNSRVFDSLGEALEAIRAVEDMNELFEPVEEKSVAHEN